MNRREMLLSLACAIFAPAARAAGSSENGSETNELLDAAKGMVGWFKFMLANVSEIVAAERRHQLVVRLRNLNSDLVQLSAQKYDLLEILRGQLPGPPHGEVVALKVEEVTVAIGSLRMQVLAVTAELRENYKVGGDECAKLLNAALTERKAWINNLGSVDLNRTIQRGELAVRGLDSASEALGKLIAALDPPPLG